MTEPVRDVLGHYRKGKDVYGECEANCGKMDCIITVHYGNMWLCSECWDSEQKIKQANITEVHAVDALHKAELNLIEASRVLDKSVEVRTDIFNAATIATVEIEKTVDDDASIENKPYAKAELLMNRFKSFQEAAFQKREELVEIENNLKAIQIRMNQLANTLRSEEREKLKIADINYNPAKVKPAKIKSISTKTVGPKKQKIAKEDIRKAAAELGISEFIVHQILIQKQCTLDEAKIILLKMLDSAKAEQAIKDAPVEEEIVDMDTMEN